MPAWSSQRPDRRRILGSLIGGASLLALAGCQSNGGSGYSATIYNAGESLEKDMEKGRQFHPSVLREFGGAYGSSDIQSLINEIGQKLSADVERQGLQYRFTVLNSDIVNAFSTPGGYVYITRGCLPLADTVSEVAAILAHELGHIALGHVATRYADRDSLEISPEKPDPGRELLTGAHSMARSVDSLGETVGSLLLAPFNDDQELEAARLAAGYLARAGYDPQAILSISRRFRQDSDLRARMAGQVAGAPSRSHFLATHPLKEQGLADIVKNADSPSKDAQDTRDREAWLKAIDGILYGDDPQEGVIRGQDYLHPGLRFRFSVPEGFQLVNGADQVRAVHKSGAGLVFDIDSLSDGQTVRSYLTGIWGKDTRLEKVETLRVNKLQAATAVAKGKAAGKTVDLRLVVILSGKLVNRFLFISPPSLTSGLQREFRQTSQSFSPLTREDMQRISPMRLEILSAQAADSGKALVDRMAVPSLKREHWELLNNRKADQAVQSGDLIKLVLK